VAIETLGVVLKATPIRESDLLLTLFTEDHGKLSAVARGARRSQKRFTGALQLLVLARFQLGRRPRGELWSLDNADIVREWSAISRDVVGVAHASYAAELLGALVPAETPEPAALELVVALWDSLADAGPSVAALRAYELAVLDVAGHRPALDRCAACGAVDLETGAVFDPGRGGAICRRCAATSRDPGVRPLAAGTLAYLRAIAASESIAAARAFDDGVLAEDRIAAREAMLAMVTALAGHPLKTLEYLAKLSSATRRE